MHTLYENKIYVRKLCIYKMLWSKILRNKKSNKKEKKKSCSDYRLCRLLLAVGSRGEGKWKLIKVCITSYVVCACVCAPVRKIERPHARQRSRVRLDFRFVCAVFFLFKSGICIGFQIPRILMIEIQIQTTPFQLRRGGGEPRRTSAGQQV